MRSLGENPRKDVSDIYTSFPEIAEDFVVPDWCPPADRKSPRYFSSAFRISSANVLLLLLHFCGCYIIFFLLLFFFCHDSCKCGHTMTSWTTYFAKFVEKRELCFSRPLMLTNCTQTGQPRGYLTSVMRISRNLEIDLKNFFPIFF